MYNKSDREPIESHTEYMHRIRCPECGKHVRSSDVSGPNSSCIRCRERVGE